MPQIENPDPPFPIYLGQDNQRVSISRSDRCERCKRNGVDCLEFDFMCGVVEPLTLCSQCITDFLSVMVSRAFNHARDHAIERKTR